MVLVVLLFVFALLLPLTMRLEVVQSNIPRELLLSAAALALVLAVAALLWRTVRLRAARPPSRPDAATLAGLNWPAKLRQTELEACCAAYLSQTGWEVATAQGQEAGSIYLDATRPGARALLMCQSSDALTTPPVVRTLAIAARDLPGARPALLTMASLPKGTRQAAAETGVAVLQVADLRHLPELAATTPPPP